MCWLAIEEDPIYHFWVFKSSSFYIRVPCIAHVSWWRLTPIGERFENYWLLSRHQICWIITKHRHWGISYYPMVVKMLGYHHSIGYQNTICMSQWYPSWKKRAKQNPLVKALSISHWVQTCYSWGTRQFCIIMAARLASNKTPYLSWINNSAEWIKEITNGFSMSREGEKLINQLITEKLKLSGCPKVEREDIVGRSWKNHVVEALQIIKRSDWIAGFGVGNHRE